MDGTLRVYESDNMEAGVTNLSEVSSLIGSGKTYTLSTSATPDFLYIRHPITEALGHSETVAATRSDGKVIKPDNVWISKIRTAEHGWDYFVNLFDANGTELYTLVFEGMLDDPQPPVFETIPDQTVCEGDLVSFVVTASDPNGTIPALSAEPLPVGVSFLDQGDGRGLFEWTPAAGQAGEYPFTFRASDGELSATQQMTVFVRVNAPVVISGYVWSADGTGLADVVLNGLPRAPTTNAMGFYQVEVASGWGGTVTPQKTDYTFHPVFRSYSSLMTDLTDQDYTGTPIMSPTPTVHPDITPTPTVPGGAAIPEPGTLLLLGFGLLGLLWLGLKNMKRNT
jgi:hypothetical protein